jgi:DNA helicase-2/ATP-dependent DNA helicase PcrA
LDDIYKALNDRQLEAVMSTEGPVLILAGAGSGKTKALTHRVAYLIKEKHVEPWRIMAITFTNKAAEEMRKRVDSLVGLGSENIWVATFHATCSRILRRHADRLGYTHSFSIYDTDDQRTLMKQVIKKLDLDPKMYKEKMILAQVSGAKNSMITPEQMEKEGYTDFRQRRIAEAYGEYQKQLKLNNAMDFDDLLNMTVQLFRENPDILEYYQRRFSYVMVDEYQDTNHVQFEFVRLLTKESGNLCVVGDDDQSIYGFRGADIRNILDFAEAFPEAKVIKLEQNYRSTKMILGAANSVIGNNRDRKDKTLWTENEEGPKVSFICYGTAYNEAEGIVADIVNNKDRFHYGDCAVLYRTNAQSRLLEEKCVMLNVPYRMVGGVNFYQRKEIKDILCYLKTIENGSDDLAVERIVNVPRRGIGTTSIDRVRSYALDHDISLYEALLKINDVPGVKASVKVKRFTGLIEEFKRKAPDLTVAELIQLVLELTGYKEELIAEGTIEAQTRLENLGELISKAEGFDDGPDDGTALTRFLQEVSLVADVDNMTDDDDKVTLMTLHAAKGLEFPKVYLAGMEERLFPGVRAVSSPGEEEMEEERRLCYVGITRAQKELVLTASRMRIINGEPQFQTTSRFVNEINEEYLETVKTGGNAMEKQDENSGSGMYRPKPKVLTSGSAAVALGKQFEVKKAEGLSYGVGDRVRHVKFGEGTVLSVEDGKKDYEVVVNFDKAGEKKLFASFAKLQKV